MEDAKVSQLAALMRQVHNFTISDYSGGNASVRTLHNTSKKVATPVEQLCYKQPRRGQKIQ